MRSSVPPCGRDCVKPPKSQSQRGLSLECWDLSQPFNVECLSTESCDKSQHSQGRPHFLASFFFSHSLGSGWVSLCNLLDSSSAHGQLRAGPTRNRSCENNLQVAKGGSGSVNSAVGKGAVNSFKVQ